MSLLNLALAYVSHRKLVTLFTVLSIALGMALVLVVLNVRREIERTFLQQVHGYDLVVGAGGSETALVLCGLFHADQPRGNLSFRTYEELAKQAGVRAAFPFSLGDRYRGARIVGTTRAFLTQTEAGPPLFTLAEGRLFEKDFELVAGAAAARRYGLVVGSRIVGAHGAIEADHDDEEPGDEHHEFPYTVVGVLQPTGTAHDRALFTTLESYWQIHGVEASAEGPEVTVILLRVARPVLLQLQRLLPRKFAVLAVRPAEVLQRMFEQVLAPLEKVLLTYGYAVAAVAACSILTTLYLATLVRRRDLAILRALGATPREVFTVVFCEAVLLLLFGCALGVVLSQAAGLAASGDLERRFGVAIGSMRFTPAEVLAIGVMFVFGLAAALWPARQAYKADVATGLGRF